MATRPGSFTTKTILQIMGQITNKYSYHLETFFTQNYCEVLLTNCVQKLEVWMLICQAIFRHFDIFDVIQADEADFSCAFKFFVLFGVSEKQGTLSISDLH